MEVKMRRSEGIQVRLSPKERQIIEIIASQEGTSISQALRNLVRDEARRRGVWLKSDQEPEKVQHG
jgi:hypothetical protein